MSEDNIKWYINVLLDLYRESPVFVNRIIIPSLTFVRDI